MNKYVKMVFKILLIINILNVRIHENEKVT